MHNDLSKALDVSIHAPVKGRPLLWGAGQFFLSFNPRPREGATGWAGGHSPRAGCFNPRPREGATGETPGAVVVLGVSIHAPVKGRRVTLSWLAPLHAFQSTPP